MSTSTSLPVLITPAPRIAARDSSEFLGFYLTESSTQILTCFPDSIYTTSGSFGGCYPTTFLSSNSFLFTTCSQSSSVPSTQGPLLVCNFSTYSCIVQTIIQTYPSSGAFLTNYFCKPGWQAFTIYRNMPQTSTSSSSPTGSTSSPISTSSFPSTLTSPSSTTTTPQGQNNSTPGNAWIAGVVIGSTALIAFISFGLWFIRNRRRERNFFQHISRHREMRSVPPEFPEERPDQGVSADGNQRTLYEMR